MYPAAVVPFSSIRSGGMSSTIVVLFPVAVRNGQLSLIYDTHWVGDIDLQRYS